jgi:micrococcal nuclease
MQKLLGSILVAIVMIGALLFASEQTLNNSDAPVVVPERQTVSVVSVADGDTIRVNIAGQSQLVRIIGIDTPEVSGSYTKDECYGKEASDVVRGVLEGKSVTLEYDASQGRLDQYDRILAHVFYNGENLGALLVEGGHAREFTYRTPHKYSERYKKLEKSAQDNQFGMWDPEMCPQR